MNYKLKIKLVQEDAKLPYRANEEDAGLDLFSIEKNSFLWLAVAHQFVAMSLLLSFVWMIYIIRPATQR